MNTSSRAQPPLLRLREIRQPPQIPPREIRILRPGLRLIIPIDPGTVPPVPLRRTDVVLETERHMHHRLSWLPNPGKRLLEKRISWFVNATILGRDHIIERNPDVFDRMSDQIVIAIRHDHQLDPRRLHPLQRRLRIVERLPASHRSNQRLTIRLGVRITPLLTPEPKTLPEHHLVILVRPLNHLELNRLPPMPQLPASWRRIVTILESSVIQKVPDPALPIDERPKTIKRRRRNLRHRIHSIQPPGRTLRARRPIVLHSDSLGSLGLANYVVKRKTE